MRFTVSTRRSAGLAANFYAADALAQQGARRVVKRHMNIFYSTTKAITPVDSGRMKRLLRKKLSEQGFTFQVGWDEQDFTDEEVPFYVIYVLFGTSKMPARDVLFAPNEGNGRAFQADLSIELKRAVRRRTRNSRRAA